MIRDPEARGLKLAEFYFELAPRLFGEIVESGAISAADAVARAEWEWFALYACVRGLVAAGGFNRETARAIEALHQHVLERWESEPDAGETTARRARVAERYAEYGAIGQEGGASGAATVTARLGAAAASHMSAPATPPPALASIAGELHEALVEGAAEAVRSEA